MFNFPNPDINKFILQTLQKLFTLCTGTTFLTRVFEALAKFFIPWTLTCLRAVLRLAAPRTDVSRKPVWRAVSFQNRMEVRFVPAATRGFFFRFFARSSSRFFSLLSKRKKKPLAPRVV